MRIGLASPPWAGRLWPAAARAAALAVFALAVGLQIALIPINARTIIADYRITDAYPAVAHLASRPAFADYVMTVRYAVLALFLGAAALILWRKLNDRMAVVVALTLAVVPVAFSLGGYSETWAYYPPPWRGLLLAARELLAWGGAILGLVAVFFLFPDGRFSPPAIRPAALGLGGLLAVFAGLLALGSLLGPNANWPLAYTPAGEWLFAAFFITLLAALLLGAASQVYRYQRASGPEQRRQTKLVVLGLAAFPLGYLLSGVLNLADGPPALIALADIHLHLLIMSLIPLSISISILRHKLWDIDVLINRALVYGLLTALIIGVYVVGVGLANALLQTRANAAVALLALIPAAVLAAPLRGLLQAGVGRLVPLAARATPPVAGPERTILAGRWLLAARLAALAVLLLAAVLFATNVLAARQGALGDSSWLIGLAAPAASPFISARAFNAYVLALQLGSSLIFLLVAAVLAWRRSRDWMALLAAVTLALSGAGLLGADGSASQVIFAPAWQPVMALVKQSLGMASVPLLLALFYLFPDGRFAPGWMRGAAGVSAVVLFGLPLLQTTGLDWLYYPWIGAFITSALLALGGQVYRYRRASSAVERQQTKWVVLALGAQPAWMAFVLLGLALTTARFSAPFALLAIHVQVLSLTVLPLAIGFAVMRYRLWDVEWVVNRALVYGGLTAAVVGLYVLLVGALSALLQSSGSLALSILTTGLIALLLQPLRQRLQRGVNRLMYGERDDPATVLSRLGQRLQAAIEPQAALATIVDTVAQALKLPYVAIALRQAESGQLAPAAQAGAPTAQAEAWPLVYQSEDIGQLLAAPRAAGEDFSPADRRLLSDIAHQASPAVHAARLTTELQRSRENLVAAREEERRRLRRDLHDGLGSVLAGVQLQSGALSSLYRQDPAAGDAAVAELRAQLRGAVADIRRLVYDLRPPALDELGLALALRSLAQKAEAARPADGLRVQVEAPESLGSLPAAVEVAAYRIAQEALANVVAHSRAQNCTLRASARGGALRLEIEDDGAGLPEQPTAGVGLRSMMERAAELGGTCEIGPRPGGGARVAVRLPLPANLTEAQWTPGAC